MAEVDDAAFWEGLYRSGQDGWELGAPSPPLVRAVGALGPEVLRGAAVVLGCGRGHEARLLAGAGFARVVAVDFARPAIEEARALTPPGSPAARAIEWRLADVFSLGATDAGAFDLALEHTCFCAIDPARRPEWAATVARVLRPGGTLVAAFYAHGRPGA
jgi:thiopurine S-methyltransferase